MHNILTLFSSLSGQHSQSSKLARQITTQLQQQGNTNLVERDLAGENLPHLSSEEMQSWQVAAEQQSPEQALLATLSDTLIAEVQQADTLVIGVPMYNFGIPSVLKAWIDRIARAGITFNYTENGPVGLLTNKRVIIAATRGGKYAGTDQDSQTRFLIDVFNFVGIKDVEFVYAEGLAMGSEQAEIGWETANKKIFELIATTAA